SGPVRLQAIASRVTGRSCVRNHLQATYPAFLTNDEFAEDFLGNVLGDNVAIRRIPTPSP
ncbi:MAG: hypothetical protein OXI13_08055, partial [Gammaproteobacteria bacterium]|nr:hypothetical protein [Gammaproteobacteria bacterium]MDE0479563.1 hypothetical protein [Gammaproteobacteria bacterium]